MAENYYVVQTRVSQYCKWLTFETQYKRLEDAKREMAWWKEQLPHREFRVAQAYVQVRYKAVKE